MCFIFMIFLKQVLAHIILAVPVLELSGLHLSENELWPRVHLYLRKSGEIL